MKKSCHNLSKSSFLFHNKKFIQKKQNQNNDLRNKSFTNNNSQDTTNLHASKSFSFLQTLSKHSTYYYTNKNFYKHNKSKSNLNINNIFQNFKRNSSSLIKPNKTFYKNIYQEFDEKNKERKNRIENIKDRRKLRMKIFNILKKNPISLCNKFENINSKYNNKIIKYLKGPYYLKKCINSNSKFKYNYLDRENIFLSRIYHSKIDIKNLPKEILKENLSEDELKSIWQKPNYFLNSNPYLKNTIIKKNKSLLENFQIEEEFEKINNENIKKDKTLNDIFQLKIKINNNNLEEKIENLKKEVSQKIIKMNLQNKKKGFIFGKKNMPKQLNKEIENNMKKLLKYSYSSEEIHHEKNDDEFIPKLIEKDLKEYSLIKNKRNLNKGFERLFQNVEKLDKEKIIENNIKDLKQTFIKMYKFKE
jgi:hypothetical protein